MSSFRIRWGTLCLLVTGVLAACGGSGTSNNQEKAPVCIDREAGCQCPSDGLELPCYDAPRFEGTDQVCSVGKQICQAGVWTACTNYKEKRYDLSTALIAPPTACNPCNPACFVAESETIDNSELTPDNSDEVVFDPTVGGVVSDTDTETDTTSQGVGGDDPFDTTGDDENSGVLLDPTGAIVLDSAPGTVDDSIWIANTGEGTISRFDIASLQETGRYWTGPLGGNNDPSRTSINTAGDAFVAGRRGKFLTKISGLRDACPDTNNDGAITTSSTPTALPWGQDDCVLWSTDLSGIMPAGFIRAVAAQDIIDPVTGNVTEYVWVGGYSNRRIAVLDGSTGAILMDTDIGVGPYGFAFDGSQNLWVSTIGHKRLVKIDTTRCNAAGCPAAGLCTESSTTSDDCVNSIKRAIRIPANNRSYGVTVDASQRVWIGGDIDVMRYEPNAAPANRWTRAFIPVGGWKAGITVDGSNNVYTAGSFGTFRMNADDPTIQHRLTANRGWGVAIAADNRAWVIGRWSNSSYVIDPGPTVSDNTVVETVASLNNPYTYSDMTGQQLRLAATPRGVYVSSFEGCGDNTRWESLTFDVETPPNTSVSFRVRTADTQIALNGAQWYGVGVVPTGVSPLAVGTVLDIAGVTHGRMAQVEIALESSILDPTMFATPKVNSVLLNHSCSAPQEGYYERVFDSTQTCNVPPAGPERPFWNSLDYHVETPSDSQVDVEIQVADDLIALQTAPKIIESIPANPDMGTLNLKAILQAAGESQNRLFMKIRMKLIPSTDRMSAILYNMGLQWECQPVE